MRRRQCNPVPLTFMSSRQPASLSGDDFQKSFFSGFNFFSNRDCLFPGGEEGAGGVLVAEEAFYQVTLPLKGGAQTNVFFKNNFPKYRVGDPVVP